ncbi:MAG: hypothetical protein QOF40_1813 [Actinomycetota bacterium]|nr:hypothetical protein [Actinomycetota bacterium]
MRWGRVVVCVVLLTGSVWATAGSPAVGAAVGAAASTPTAWDPRLQPIADKVAELRNLKFDHPVTAKFLTAAAFEKKVAVDKGKLTKQDKAEIARSQAQLRAVGLIGPTVDLVDAVSSLQTSGVLAYYDPKTKKVTVKGTTIDDVSTRVTLAHELTHALQDQHFDLQKLEKAATKAHASTPLQTLVEGDAVRIQQAYTSSLSQTDQDAYQAAQASTSATARTEITAKGVPEALAVLFEAPYDLGQTMLDAVISKEKVAGVDALFVHPPTADAAYVTPSTLLEHRVFPDVAPPALAKGERAAGKPDTFGAFALYQVLASRLDPSVALTAADAWGGDAMVTFTRKGTTCLRAKFVGKTPDGTQSIDSALSQWAAQMPAGAAQVDAKAERVTLTACDPGATATEAPNRALQALVFVATRDGLFAEVVRQGLPVAVASCAADALVRDPAFKPVIDGAVADPSAGLDPGALAGVQARAPAILSDCTASRSA